MRKTMRSVLLWKGLIFSILFGMAFFSVNCFSVNVHIYFPAARVRQAAAEIEGDVRSLPQEGDKNNKTDQKKEGSISPQSRNSFSIVSFLAIGRFKISLGMPQVEAQEIDLKISTSAIEKIKASRKKRYPKVFALMEKGAVGETYDGFLATRKKGLSSMSFKERRQAEKIVKAENKDRKALYKELARANNIDRATIPQIGRIFAQEILQHHCKPNHWFKNEKGEWMQVKDIKKR